MVPFLIVGCSKPQEIAFEAPKVQVPKKQPPTVRKKGSLYSKRGASLFADKKDLQVGDIIQVVINEALTKDTNNKRELTNDRTNALGGGLLTPMAGNVLSGGTASRSERFNKQFGVDFNTTSNESTTGEVKTKVDESFETTISVIIQDTYQNGNYYIKGSKDLLIDEQHQEIVVSGVIRPYDITPENSIMSSQIANLKVMYKKEGEEQDIMHVPWGYKVMRALWPF
jgi:flagellar L-ring protein precursor FlgH